jgi:GNAT superfamily N-acetyltransferase
MDAVRIMPAQPADVPDILRLITALGEYEKLRHEVVATEADLQASLFGTTPCAEALVARAGREAVGFALFFHNFSTFLGRRGLYLEDLFVLPEWRGRGIGRRLLTRLAWIAVERGCGRMEWTVLDWNEPAIRFYGKLGAAVMHDWRICRITGPGLARLAASADT